MTAKPPQFHPEAVSEAERARDWYAQRSSRAAQGFLVELSHGLERIGAKPEAWPQHDHGTRRYSLLRYPFLVIYRVYDDRIVVLAVAHTKRRPGYWASR